MTAPHGGGGGRDAGGVPDGQGRDLRDRIGPWLEEVLADEPLPGGVSGELAREILDGSGGGADEEADLYSLWAAVTALTQEVKLQGRSFDRLGRSLADVERLAGAVESMVAQDDPGETGGPGGGEPAEQVLMDVRDRLEQGARVARECLERARAGGRLRSIAGGGPGGLLQAVKALEEGYGMATARVDRALGGYGVRSIECAGMRFDPERMTAVAVVHDARVADGSVVDVVRPGYERDGVVVRFAQVRVARRHRDGSEPAGMLDRVVDRVVDRLRLTLGGGPWRPGADR